jgi:hypothetical protein
MNRELPAVIEAGQGVATLAGQLVLVLPRV